jgi:hypothetical protein
MSAMTEQANSTGVGSNVSVASTPIAPTQRHKQWSTTLFALCIAFVLVRLPFMFTVPMGEAPDEFAHYWVIKFVSEQLRLPTATEVAAGGPSAVYGSLPQLGYIPHILLAWATPHAQLPLFERFGSLFMGLVLLYAAYLIGRELFPRSRLLQLAVPVVVIFHPQLAFLHAYANSDSTSSALASILVFLVLRSVRQGVTVRVSAFIGLLAGWLALSKYSGLAVMPVLALGLVAAAVLNRSNVRQTVYSAVICIAAFAATCGWWFWRNAHEFAGDTLGTQTMYRSWATTFHKDLHYYVPASHIIKELRWWRMMFFSFWGMFGYMTKYMWRPVYFGYLGFLIAAGLGMIIAVRRSCLALASRLNSISSETLKACVNWSCLFLVVLINLGAMIWASTGNLGGPQGRYLFTSEVPVAALLIAGLDQLGGQKFGRRLVVAFLLFNACVCVGAWIMLVRMYGIHIQPL